VYLSIKGEIQTIQKYNYICNINKEKNKLLKFIEKNMESDTIYSYPPYAEKIIIGEKTSTWIESWDTPYQELATRIWNEYVADESLLTYDGLLELDEVMFGELETYVGQ